MIANTLLFKSLCIKKLRRDSSKGVASLLASRAIPKARNVAQRMTEIAQRAALLFSGQ